MNIRASITDLLCRDWKSYRFVSRSDGLLDLELKRDFNRVDFDYPNNLNRLSKVAHIKGDWVANSADQLDQLRVVSGNLTVGRMTRRGHLTVNITAPELEMVLGNLHLRAGHSFLNAPNLYWVAGDLLDASRHPDSLWLPSLQGIGGHLGKIWPFSEDCDRTYLPSLVALGGALGVELPSTVVQERLGPLGALALVRHYRHSAEAAVLAAGRVDSSDSDSPSLGL